MPSEDRPDPRGVNVPADRFSRMVRLGGLAGGIAGGMVVDGLRQFASGRRPSLPDLLLTPSNARKVTQQLAQMRGAAMKVGQLLSMDAGDVLPPEMATIFARLRADAEHMPPKQLQTALNAEWGTGWISRFSRFDVRPIAAASIGQVHRARTKDGRDLAIKVQYPGIRNSIDSDVNNVAAIIRMSGALPKGMDWSPMLNDAKRQLHDEADYLREAGFLSQFGTCLADNPAFAVPRLHADFSTANVLAMDFMDSVPIEHLADAAQDLRDQVMARMITLVLKELFTFGLMQTDPNFANYRFNPTSGQIVLLDFGATRALSPAVSAQFRRLMRAGLAGNRDEARLACLDAGLFGTITDARHQEIVLDMFDLAMAPVRQNAPFDFGKSDLANRLRDMGMAIGSERDFWHVPPVDTLFVQRKVAGMYLLGARLGARVAIGPLVAPFA